jgi:hypothetical protein
VRFILISRDNRNLWNFDVMFVFCSAFLSLILSQTEDSFDEISKYLWLYLFRLGVWSILWSHSVLYSWPTLLGGVKGHHQLSCQHAVCRLLPLYTIEQVDHLAWNLVWTLCHQRPPQPQTFLIFCNGDIQVHRCEMGITWGQFMWFWND